jgi:hypothetical protein
MNVGLAGGSTARPALPLAVTLALHLLLALVWLHGRPHRPAGDGAPEVLSSLLPLTLPAPAPVARKARPQRPAPAARRIPSLPVHEPASVPAPTPAAAPVAAPAAGDIVARAIQDAGKIDRELRYGKPGVLSDTGWSRLERGLAAAHIDRSRGVTTDSYTSPDGVVIYRSRQNGKQRCRMSGSIGPPGVERSAGAILAGAGSGGGGGTAGTIDCPSGERDWTRR